MDDSNNNLFSNMQWKQFEQFFSKKFPFPTQGSPDDLSWVDQLVQNTLNQTMSKSAAGMKQNPTAFEKSEIFETVTHIIVKINVAEKEKAKNMKIYSSVHQLRLEEYGINVQKHIISFPAHIIPESCKAVYKNGLLQLYFRKQQVDDHFHEIHVRFLS